jgi:hypothetical protein
VTTTLLAHSVPSDALPAYKAGVIILLVVVQSPAAKEFWRRHRPVGRKVATEAAGEAGR